MYVMTYSSLLEDIRNYLDRGNVNDPTVYQQLPHIVAMAEKNISLRVKCLGFKRFVTSTFTDGVPVVAKPERWRQTVSINYGTGTGGNTRTVLYERGLEYLQEAYAVDQTATGAPVYYADYGWNHWLIAPTPDANYPFQANYYEIPQPLDESNQTNWTTQFAPQLLLYACLLECTPFLVADERIPTWQSMYQQAADGLMGQDRGQMIDSSTVRTNS